MTVLIKKGPPPRYQSIGGPGSTEEDREKADRLDQLLARHISDLVTDLTGLKLMPRGKGGGSVLTYWYLGSALRNVISNDDLIKLEELPLLWRAANENYIPDELKYADRGPYREHLYYCYRLASYARDMVQKMNWGEWVTIFDSAGINQEPRFDAWFRDKLLSHKGRISREQIRVFAPCVNTMLGDIVVEDLAIEQLHRCYEAAWHLMELCLNTNATKTHVIGRNDLQKAIEAGLGKLDAVMTGDTSPLEYARVVMAAASLP